MYKFTIYHRKITTDSYIFNTFLCVECQQNGPENSQTSRSRTAKTRLGQVPGIPGIPGTNIYSYTYLFSNESIILSILISYTVLDLLDSFKMFQGCVIWELEVFFQATKSSHLTPNLSICQNWAFTLQDITKDIVRGGPRICLTSSPLEPAGTGNLLQPTLTFPWVKNSSAKQPLETRLWDTLPETNIAPENRPSQKETSIQTINFQGLC